MKTVTIFHFIFIFFLLSDMHMSIITARVDTGNNTAEAIKIIDDLVKIQQSIKKVNWLLEKKRIIPYELMKNLDMHKGVILREEKSSSYLIVYPHEQVEIIPVIFSETVGKFDRYLYFINEDQKKYVFFPLYFPLKKLGILMPYDTTDKAKEELGWILMKLDVSYTGDIVHCLNVHFQTWEHLVKMGEGIIPKVTEAIKDSESSWVRSTLIAVLCKFIPGNSIATHAIMERLEDEDMGIQIIAAYRLGELKVKEALPLLKQKLTDNTYYCIYREGEEEKVYPVREAAQKAIESIMDSK